jgi:hypothetical protein
MNDPQSRARRPLRRVCSLAAAAALAAAGLCPALAGAAAIYSNFDPLATSPGDYSTSHYADISGYCASVYCPFINVFSAGFSFTAAQTGVAAYAYLPLNAQYTAPGMERFYRISILNSLGQVVVQGGLLGRSVPIGATQVYEFGLNRDYETGQVLADSDELVAGETYTAYFSQRFGSMSQTHWMASDVVPTSGQAQQYCSANVGGLCAFWSPGWVNPLGAGNASAAITDFLPALALADGRGYTPPTPQGVPEPGGLALAAMALGALTLARRRA